MNKLKQASAVPMTQKARSAIALLFAALLLSGCSRVGVPPTPTPDTPRIEATLLPVPGTPLVMPRPRPSSQGTVVIERLTAQIGGKLTKTNECLRIGDFALAWPPDVMVIMDGDVVHVIGTYGKGQRWDFNVGEQVSMGGGEVRPAFTQEFEELRISSTCPGPYWLFGGSIRSALTPTPR